MDLASSIRTPASPASFARRTCWTTFPVRAAIRVGAEGKAPNSTFITVAPVPEDLTTVSVPGQNIPGYWINKPEFQCKFHQHATQLTPARQFRGCADSKPFLRYFPASAVPQPPAPVPGDTLLTNTACPAAGGANPPAATRVPTAPAARQRLSGRAVPAALFRPGLRWNPRAAVHTGH